MILASVLAVSSATAVQANFTAEATVRPGLADVKKAILVTVRCHELFNCDDVERRVLADFIRLKVPFSIVAPTLVQSKLLDLGVEDYSVEMRSRLAEAFEANALVELELLHGEARSLGRSGSEVAVKMRIVAPSGEILMIGSGAGRAINTVSAPESIAQETFERILKKAFDR